MYVLNFYIQNIEYSSIYQQQFSNNIEELKKLKTDWENEINDLYHEGYETYNGYNVIEKPYCEIIKI